MEKVAVIFSAPDFTSKDYDKVWDDLRAAGQEYPKGLISHVGFRTPEGRWMVVDAWESKEAFNEFAKTLLPIIQKTGRQVPPPQVVPAHYVYQPKSEKVLG